MGPYSTKSCWVLHWVVLRYFADRMHVMESRFGLLGFLDTIMLVSATQKSHVGSL